MGKKAIQIVELNVKELIQDLNKAYSDEWVAFYSYRWAAEMAEGINSPIVADALKKTAEQELEHSKELAERIIQLGGTPVKDFEAIEKTANFPKVKFPADTKDYRGILKAVIGAERGAIDVYNKILKKVMVGKDPVTFHIVRHIMEEEIQHEDLFETILGK